MERFVLVLELTDLKVAALKAESQSQAIWSFLRSQRGAPLIVHSGYVYRNERKSGIRTYWLCIRYKGKKCNARLILNGNTINKATSHNHTMDDRACETHVEWKNLEDDDLDTWLKGLKKDELNVVKLKKS